MGGSIDSFHEKVQIQSPMTLYRSLGCKIENLSSGNSSDSICG